MKKKYIDILMIVGLVITVIGLITGKFFFLFLLLPIGFEFFRKKKDKGED